MIVKGIVSSVDTENSTVEVILPEYKSIVTQPLKVYGNSGVSSLRTGDFVTVIFFNNDFTDGLVFLSVADMVSAINIIDSLSSNSTVDGLSANQGNVLYKMIQETQVNLSDEPISNTELEAILK